MADDTTTTARVRERALRLALHKATRLRQATHERIVRAFGTHVQDGGPEPQDEDLRWFAKLASDEQRLRRRYAESVVAAWRVRVEAARLAGDGSEAGPPPALPLGVPSHAPVRRPGVQVGGTWPVHLQGVTARLSLQLRGVGDFFRLRAAEIRRRASAVAAGPSPTLGRAPERSMSRRLARSFPNLPRWRTVLWTEVAVLALAAAFASWHTYRLRSLHPPPHANLVAAASVHEDATAVPARAAAETAALNAGHAAVPGGASPVEAQQPVQAPPAASQPPRMPSAAGAINSKRVVLAHGGDTPRARVLASVRYEPDVLESCRNSNFFARAICMNNRCAQPQLKRHPQCAVVVSQRQRDEERRNPTMLN
jgi:hypothetical protein